MSELFDLMNSLNAVTLQGLKSGQEIGRREADAKIKVLVDALLEIRRNSASGSLEMSIVDHALEKIGGPKPWIAGYKGIT